MTLRIFEQDERAQSRSLPQEHHCPKTVSSVLYRLHSGGRERRHGAWCMKPQTRGLGRRWRSSFSPNPRSVDRRARTASCEKSAFIEPRPSKHLHGFTTSAIDTRRATRSSSWPSTKAVDACMNSPSFGPLSIDDARSTAIQIAPRAASEHTAGITHRDVKPANIIVTNNGAVQTPRFRYCQTHRCQQVSTNTAVCRERPLICRRNKCEANRMFDREPIPRLWCLLSLTKCSVASGPSTATRFLSSCLRSRRPRRNPSQISAGDVPAPLAAVVNRALVKDRDQRYQNFQ